MSNPNCSQCRHYYITWNQKTPNGCRRFGIQCQGQPSTVVSMAGLGECQGFEPKKRPDKDKERPGLDLNRKELW